MGYLGTDFDPDSYYESNASSYTNAQSDAVGAILRSFLHYVRPTVLDLGAGSGLATSLLYSLGVRGFTGVDRSASMSRLYREKTSLECFVRNFWDELPPSTTAVAAHSLHLCPKSRVWEFEHRLRESGVETLIVTSPLKRAAAGITLNLVDETRVPSGASGKTVWGWVFSVS